MFVVRVGAIAALLRPPDVGVSFGFHEQALDRGLLQQGQRHLSGERVPLRERLVLVERVVRHGQALDAGHCKRI